VLAFDPDVVIVATGGLPNFGDLEGEELCLSTWDILSGDVKPEKRVLVYDGTGRHEALSCAEFIADKGSAWRWVMPSVPRTASRFTSSA